MVRLSHKPQGNTRHVRGQDSARMQSTTASLQLQPDNDPVPESYTRMLCIGSCRVTQGVR